MVRSQLKSAIQPRSISNPIPSKYGSTQKISANIKVAVRVRPLNGKELNLNSRKVVDVVDDKMLVFDPKEEVEPFFYQGVKQQNRSFLRRPNKDMKFMFDCVFGAMASNEDVFRATTKEVLSALMDGFNCSVFVYGATGAGKTFTMIGSKECPGITYLTMEHLFYTIDSFKKERDFEILVSYLEVYNENVYDLLKPSKAPLQLREDAKFGVVVAGLTINTIHTARELLEMLESGNMNRTQHPTDANAESSRSHAVFQVYVKMRYKTSGECQLAKLSMIDLAGSERASATGCVGERFKEGANINRSLLALGNCINKLADGCKYIPYRDSKLTRLLKDSLGGNCQTIMIANISPSSLSFEDTYNTLKYAARANKIQLTIKKNIVDADVHVTQYLKIIEELKKEVKELKAKLALSSTSVKKESGYNDAAMKQWRATLEDEERKFSMIENRLLTYISQHKILMLRHTMKQRALSNLAKMTPDKCVEATPNDYIKQEISSSSFLRQSINMQQKIQELWHIWKSHKDKLSKLFNQTLNECPELSDFVARLKMNSDLRQIRARDTLRLKLLQIEQEEIASTAAYTDDIENMFTKFFLMLKGYDKVTPSMQDAYKEIFQKKRKILTQKIKWFDCDDNQCSNDGIIQFINTLDLSEKPEIIHIGLVTKKEVTNISDSDTDQENERPIKKRKSTPRKPQMNDTIIIDDSLSDFDATRIVKSSPSNIPVRSPMPKPLTIDNIAAEEENFISPCNITFEKLKCGDVGNDKPSRLEIKKGLTDRTNSIQKNASLPDKFGKTSSFRRPNPVSAGQNNVNPAQNRLVKPAFGSSAPRGGITHKSGQDLLVSKQFGRGNVWAPTLTPGHQPRSRTGKPLQSAHSDGLNY